MNGTMTLKTSIPYKLRMLTTALLTVAVFCFWGYVRPYLITERELTQMFLWNCDYFMERIAVPGGLARYIGEWLVQFFVYIKYGAAIYALLFLLVQWLCWRLTRRFPLSLVLPVLLWWLALDTTIPMTLHVAFVLALAAMAVIPHKEVPALPASAILVPVVYWLAGPVALLIPLYHLRWFFHRPLRWKAAGWTAGLLLLFLVCLTGSSRLVPYPLRELARGIDYRWEEDIIGTYQDMTYSTLLRRRQWESMVKLSISNPPQSLASQNAARLALWHTKRVGNEALRECLQHSRRVMASAVTASIMSNVYLEIGMLNMSQRSAFDLMESIPNGNKSGRAIKRLAETALYTGQHELALKYILLLEQTLFYRSWASSMRRFAEHPEQMESVPLFQHYREVYKKADDVFFY